jgi:hypothetical protein
MIKPDWKKLRKPIWRRVHPFMIACAFHDFGKKHPDKTPTSLGDMEMVLRNWLAEQDAEHKKAEELERNEYP